tara:strand:- start:27 stop:137 length:111 start_codon:yes stop_codon:yes gene_type:complete
MRYKVEKKIKILRTVLLVLNVSVIVMGLVLILIDKL